MWYTWKLWLNMMNTSLPEVQDWEEELVSSLLNLLYSLRVRENCEDQMGWIYSRRKKFEVRSFYQILHITAENSFPWKSIQWNKYPSIAAFFIWPVAQGRILTLDNLRRRHLTLINWCSMCKKSEETINHLGLRCDAATYLWASIFHSFRMPQRVVVKLLAVWEGHPSGL